MTTTTDFDRTRLSRTPRVRSLRLGDLTVTYVPDGAVRLKPHGWLPAATADDWADNRDHLDQDGLLVAGIGGLLVERGDRALLIDAGFGPESHPDDPGNPLIGTLHGGELLESLRRLGRTPEQIEAVAITHLHPDHLGWTWSDLLPFAHAAHLVAAPEWERRDLAAEPRLAVMAPRVRTVEDGEEIFPGVRASFAHGHTVGHTTYVITGGGRRLIAFGDALHTPVQVTHPEWSCGIDHDPIESAEHRRRLVEELSRPGTVGYGGHFADVVFGRAEPRPDGHLTWVPIA
ncbi:MBL fold metallo-hydrolase [Streptosporangium saharense]|uniref:Glyoxylase-like metal-dependent hydrolase (Beta-lactamase superfamily II) n=1 Tax=Streptosporangium saharense TaxID=1706840 RepID=A0A7W7QTZ3_9ACTN|nr:MBL fold metallo-hydrolase [Streptosporangium saharense]MBB4919735.1 glyoxylase-like metal-dependent hydrolase (beta-lactamase superfamily II) [Streptosporangium saharense]